MSSRFHREFFQPTTKDHDQLVLYCLSEEFQNTFIEKFGQDFIDQLERELATPWNENEITIDEELFQGNPAVAVKRWKEWIRYNWKKEVEKICKKRDFIIGYIDVFYEVEIYCKLFYYKDWGEYPSVSFPLVVEVKPELRSIGATLRQLKTYLDIIKALEKRRSREEILGLIVSFDKLSENEIRMLKDEGILFLHVNKGSIRN